MTIDRTKYKEAEPKKYLVFARAGHENVHPTLAGRLAYMCQVKGKLMNISRGFVSYAEQAAIAEAKLKANPTWHKTVSGAVYNGNKCMVAAPGTSNHEFGHAVDSSDTWVKALTNNDLAEFGLYKPMSYEPWHIQLIETKGVSKAVLKQDFIERSGDNMDVKDFQRMTGLVVDGIVGPKTRAKAQEVLKVIQQILGQDNEIVQLKKDLESIKTIVNKY